MIVARGHLRDTLLGKCADLLLTECLQLFLCLQRMPEALFDRPVVEISDIVHLKIEALPLLKPETIAEEMLVRALTVTLEARDGTEDTPAIELLGNLLRQHVRLVMREGCRHQLLRLRVLRRIPIEDGEVLQQTCQLRHLLLLLLRRLILRSGGIPYPGAHRPVLLRHLCSWRLHCPGILRDQRLELLHRHGDQTLGLLHREGTWRTLPQLLHREFRKHVADLLDQSGRTAALAVTPLQGIAQHEALRRIQQRAVDVEALHEGALHPVRGQFNV